MVKKFQDWYKIQKDFHQWNMIPQDQLVYERLKSKNWKINFEHCHYALKELLQESECPRNKDPDFYVITNIELSKKPLGELFALYKECYDRSTCGVYVAALSYYLEPEYPRPELSGLYSENIDQVFRENFSYVDSVENCSTVIDVPLNDNPVIEGTNYIFVHPNIKYFLWKNKNV